MEPECRPAFPAGLVFQSMNVDKQNREGADESPRWVWVPFKSRIAHKIWSLSDLGRSGPVTERAKLHPPGTLSHSGRHPNKDMSWSVFRVTAHSNAPSPRDACAEDSTRTALDLVEDSSEGGGWQLSSSW